MEKMNAYWKDEWVKALRGNTYNQQYGSLRVQSPDGVDGYCCLGVLADIVCKKYNMTIEFNQSYPPPEICEKVGFEYTVPKSGNDNIQSKLAGMNDDGKYSFDTIADWIELNL